MKMKMKRKRITSIIAVLMIMVMTGILGACGGGSGESGAEGATADEGSSAAEANAGIKGIVFTIPDGLETANMGENFVGYSIPNSDFELQASFTTEEVLKELPDDFKSANLAEFFEKAYIADEESIKKNNLEQSKMTICDTDAYYIKRKSDKGDYRSVSCAWLYDNNIYTLELFNRNAYDEQGNYKEDAATLTDEEITAYEAVLKTVKPGDGAQYASASNMPQKINKFSYELPEGYVAINYYEDYAEFKKEGSEVVLRISKMNDEGAKSMSDDTGSNLYDSAKAYFDSRKEHAEEVSTIAGCEAIIDKFTEEDGKVYRANADFYSDNEVYSVSMDADPYDENGLKSDATALTEEDLAVFDAFIGSFKTTN